MNNGLIKLAYLQCYNLLTNYNFCIKAQTVQCDKVFVNILDYSLGIHNRYYTVHDFVPKYTKYTSNFIRILFCY